ncbi:hypothetical protein GQ457_06G013000 [Hibiscus cannabinus]
MAIIGTHMQEIRLQGGPKSVFKQLIPIPKCQYRYPSPSGGLGYRYPPLVPIPSGVSRGYRYPDCRY